MCKIIGYLSLYILTKQFENNILYYKNQVYSHDDIHENTIMRIPS